MEIVHLTVGHHQLEYSINTVSIYANAFFLETEIQHEYNNM